MKKLVLTVFTFLSLVFAPAISYADDVKIGVLYPLTGPVAQVGKDAVAAVKTALDIINNSHNIPGMPLAKDAGLKGLGGGKISIVVGDHGGKPDVGVGETEKMLNSDKVHAMFGAYYSSVTVGPRVAAACREGEAALPAGRKGCKRARSPAAPVFLDDRVSEDCGEPCSVAVG